MIFLCAWYFLRAYNVYPALFLDDGQRRLMEVDSYYHLRHAEAVYNNYPHILRHDPYAAYPAVETGLNQGLYDVFVATLSKLTLGQLSCKDIMFGLSPTLTGIAFCALGAWLWRSVSPWTGIFFWLFLSAYPGALVQVSSVGNGDHHSFEVFCSTFLILSLHRALQPETRVRWTLLPALLLQVLFLGWAGAPLHLFFVGICFYVVALMPPDDPVALARLRKKGILFGTITSLLPVLMATVLPDAIIWGKSEHVFLGCGLALALGYPLLVWITPRLTPGRRAFLTLALLAAVPAAAQFSPEMSQAMSIFFSQRPQTISEHAQISPASLFAWFGLNALGLVITPIMLARQGRLKAVAVPVTYALGLVAFWFYTLDFGYYGPAIIAAFAAYFVSQLPWNSITAVALGVLVLLPLSPIEITTRPWMESETRFETIVHTNGLQQAAQWLRAFKEGEGKDLDYGLLAPWDWGSILAEVSKTPVGFSETNSEPLSHLFYDTRPEGDFEKIFPESKPFRFILLPARNLQGKFGTEYMVGGGNPIDLLQRGPVITYKGRSFELPVPNQAYYNIFIVRLFDRIAQNMGHYRMVFESPQQTVRAVKLKDDLSQFEFAALDVTDKEIEGLRSIIGTENQVFETSRGLLLNARLSPDVRVFEVVPGALLRGTTTPRAKVTAVLTVTAPYNKLPQIVTWTTEADDKGLFQLRVPYATGGPTHSVPGSTVTSSAYRVDTGGKTYQVAVSEEQVQSQAQVPVQ